MNLDQQIQVLMDQAPLYGSSPEEVNLIAPVLKAIAEQLQHPQYYILQNLEQQWLMTTVTQHVQPEPIIKTIINAFPNLESAKASISAFSDPQLMALPMPVIHVLFQMLAMKPIDSIVFLETSANLQSGVEISRENLQNLIELRLQSLVQSQLPPDIA